MFCIQCEQTMRTPAGNGCAYAQGMCGKTAQTSDIQDLLIAALTGLSAWAEKADELGIRHHEADNFSPRALFSTLTNVNFDDVRIAHYLQETIRLRDALKNHCLQTEPATTLSHPQAELQLNGDTPEVLRQQGQAYSPNHDKDRMTDDQLAVRLLCLYGLKGAAAYMEHAFALGQHSDEIYREYHRIMAWLGSWPTDLDALLTCAMDIGQMNFRVMQLLDNGETACFGDPTPTEVNVRPVAGKCILISGHDLHDLWHLLKQTAGTGINVYTHGEMLPAHGYPEFHAFPHLVGNYGSGWQNQQQEFARFPGPVIMTSNCIIDPHPGEYADRIWTRNMVGWPGVSHLQDHDFSAVIDQAQQMPGFPYSEIPHLLTVGFARKTLLGAADTLIELISQQKIRHVYLIGGCDGDRAERNYFTQFATQVPKDCLILTLGCGKYRFNKLDFGTLAGLPRLLDAGQCNDAYSAIMLAVNLAEKLGCGVNDLPLSLVLSWFEQKAIVILLTLLSLGVKNILTGPTAPAFLTPAVLTLLNQQFGLRPVSDAESDMAMSLRT
ncbi:hydroxylamine reductase [Enterobacteriaceae bacterium LUAb1]